ncbi:unnamed protein product [Callosobruchus maculatus]|nr:unnamed protein product [Callosobruchus maculatus]
MECDNEINDDWMDFLKTFTRPLEEVVKAPEDEEHDPEYNILGDEDVSKIDKEELREELRIDKAVKITKKELNSLIDELLEYSDTYCSVEMNKLEQSFMADHPEESSTMIDNEESTIVAEQTMDPGEESIHIIVDMSRTQVMVLQQQMRQHVQLLTQNFILSYYHPEFHHYSSQLKEYLLNLKFLCGDKERSMFNAINLKNAVELVYRWEAIVATENEAVTKMKMHVSSTLAKMIDYKLMGNTYIPTFPTLILETIAQSDVFIYPSLLPKIPFKSAKMFKGILPFTNSEDNLIALGLEQFVPLTLVTRRGQLQWKAACVSIHEYIMPYRDVSTIKNHIQKCKSYRCSDNPIRYYFERKKAPTTVHYVMGLNHMEVLPPCKRRPVELPYQWKNFIYPNPTTVVPPAATASPLVNCHIGTFTPRKTILPNTTYFTISTPILSNQPKRKKRRVRRKAKLVFLNKSSEQKVDPITKFVKCLSRPSSIRKLLSLFMAEDKGETSLEGSSETEKPQEPLQTPEQTPKPDNHVGCIPQQQSFLDCNGSLPSMPFIATPVKTDIQPDKKNQNESPECSVNTRQNEETINTSQENSELEKDNLEDIQTLMAASSNTKAIRKEPSGAEKKKAKIRREFVANLAIAAPEDPEVERQKDEMFALAYYDKMRETLEMDDYHKIMQILNEHEADAVDLYHKVIKILRPKYEELAEEFLLFLREKEAAAVNELVPWIRMNNRSKFLRKLETYFKDQPAKLKKIYSLLVELSSTVDVSMEMVKTKLMPFFKGNAILSDLFLLNFLSEKPPASLLEGPYETIDIDREIDKTNSEEPYEVIKVPEGEDKYGCPSCICSCHEIEDPEFKTRYRHCIKCGTKFINGRVFIQSGRGLRPATVSFPMNPDKDHNVRLAGEASNALHKKRYDLSPSKQIVGSPTKENVEEETDDEKDGKKPKKTQRKRRQPAKRSNSRKDLQKLNNDLKKQFEERSDSVSPTRAEYRQNRKRPYRPKKPNVKKNVEKDEYEGEEKLPSKPGAAPGQQKRFAEEASDNEGAQTPEELPCDQKPTSPEQNTADSESEFCEESSQDNCESDSNSSTSSLSQSDSNAEEHCWKREEDKIILETFQKENDKEVAFRSISHQIRNRSKSQIRKRFDTLMKILIETIGQR